MDEISVENVVKELCSIRDVVRWSSSIFSANNIYYGHGTDNSWDEAIKLILPLLYLPLNISEEIYNANLTSQEKKYIINNVLLRVRKRIPVAYLTNKSWFCGHEFYIDRRVLIPRSPIGELITRRFEKLIYGSPNYILDMCTGSACIAISCAYEFPDAEITAVDISPDALSVAKYNVRKHSFTDNISLICSDLFSTLTDLRYDVIIANPPYVSKKHLSKQPREYSYEPKIGLLSSNRGLELIKRIIKHAHNYLTDTGILVCEVGHNASYLMEYYPNILFNWLKLDHGGTGVFFMNKAQLKTISIHF